jgi:UDP-glucose 4-epimerase
MRILITGGFGYLGGRLGQFLASEGHQVILGTRKELLPPFWLPTAETKQIRWDELKALEQLCEGVDAIIHTAGMNARDCNNDPLAALDFNGLVTARLAAAACSMKVKRFIYFSTAHVYSDNLSGIVTEETCPRNYHPYATSHLAGEYAVLAACRDKSTEGIVLRLSNSFGAPVDKQLNCWMLLLNDLSKQLVQKNRIVLHTDGTQQRNFIPINEVCRASLHLLNVPLTSLKSGIFNLGATSCSVFEMANLVRKRYKCIFNLDTEIQRPDFPADFSHYSFVFSIDKLKKTGFIPSGDFESEIDILLTKSNLWFGVEKTN